MWGMLEHDSGWFVLESARNTRGTWLRKWIPVIAEAKGVRGITNAVGAWTKVLHRPGAVVDAGIVGPVVSTARIPVVPDIVRCIRVTRPERVVEEVIVKHANVHSVV